MPKRRHAHCSVSPFLCWAISRRRRQALHINSQHYILIPFASLGSCGGLIDVPVGSVVVPKSSVAVERNLDYNFVSPEECAEQPYRISKPASRFSFQTLLASLSFTFGRFVFSLSKVPADLELHSQVSCCESHPTLPHLFGPGPQMPCRRETQGLEGSHRCWQRQRVC
jgi:hypothetical protein